MRLTGELAHLSTILVRTVLLCLSLPLFSHLVAEIGAGLDVIDPIVMRRTDQIRRLVGSLGGIESAGLNIWALETTDRGTDLMLNNLGVAIVTYEVISLTVHRYGEEWTLRPDVKTYRWNHEP
jgi:hypothetical protein